MAHIYGHSWPIRWGKEGEQREVLVYSNCETAELFLNERSLGSKKRDSQNFPAAGLRWDVAFAKGHNRLRVVARQDNVTVTDDIELTYSTEKWGKPATMKLVEMRRDGASVTVGLTLYDAKGLQCLDARDAVRFSLAGGGRMIDNLGTVHGSREVQLANGRAEISLVRSGGCVLGVTAQGLPPTFLEIT
jgi:beta-galactosidase